MFYIHCDRIIAVLESTHGPYTFLEDQAPTGAFAIREPPTSKRTGRLCANLQLLALEAPTQTRRASEEIQGEINDADEEPHR
jgi:hypothetical protein